MAYEFRQLNDPYSSGSIVKLLKRCGKKNCRCYTKNKRHLAYGLKYRVYGGSNQHKQRIIYLPKNKVREVFNQMAIMKGMSLWHHVPDMLQSTLVEHKKINNLSDDEFWRLTYIKMIHPRYSSPN